MTRKEKSYPEKTSADPKRIEEINFLRGFAVLAVILIHTTAYFTEIQDYGALVLVNLWVDIFSQFAVPMFICISGFVLASKYRAKFSLKDFYLNRIRAIIPQYLIFSVLYTLFNNWSTLTANTWGANLKLLGTNVWNTDASYHLWFFAIIIGLYILYPLIIKIYDFGKSIVPDEILLAVFLIIQLLWMVGVHSAAFAHIINVNWVAYVFYFVLGFYAWDHLAMFRKGFKGMTFFTLVMSLALTVSASFFIIIGLTTGYRYYTIPEYYFMGAELVYPILRIVTFMFLFNLAAILVQKKGVLVKMLYRLGEYSFGIYLIHIFFNQGIMRILARDQIDYNNWLFYPIVIVVTVVVSYVAVRLIRTVPYSYYLIGAGGKRGYGDKTKRRRTSPK